MIDTLTTPERIALRAAVTARLNSAEDADLVGFACDVGLDVRGILADASEPPAKHRHMAYKGRPYRMSEALREMQDIAEDIGAVDWPTKPARVEPVGLGWAPVNPAPVDYCDQCGCVGATDSTCLCDHLRGEEDPHRCREEVESKGRPSAPVSPQLSLNPDDAQVKAWPRNREAQGDRG